MKEIRITKDEYQRFRKLQTNPRPDVHAVFSTNLQENLWSFETYGLTPVQLRTEIGKRSPKLLQILGIFLEQDKPRPGGRFFIDPKGVYWKDTEKEKHRFVKWKSEEPLVPEIKSRTYAEYRAMISVR